MPAPGDDLDGEVRDVELLWWPEEAGRRLAMSAWTPRLLLVAAGADPPDEIGHLEDWLRLPLDATQFAQRREALLQRATAGRPLSVDENGVVYRGDEWTALPERELAMFRALFERVGKVVPHAELLASVRALGVAMNARLLNRHVLRLRELVGPLGLEIQNVRGAGYVLRVT